MESLRPSFVKSDQFHIEKEIYNKEKIDIVK